MLMTTFDGWEARLCGDAMALPAGQLSENELMHFRTKGSKNGVRRYQQEDGTWTPLGLKERKAREGWGNSEAEAKANKAVAKSEKKAAKAEAKAAKISAKIEKRNNKANAKAESIAAKNEKKRQNDVSKLTDEELQKKIARVKLEQEYKELTKSPVLKTGEKLVSSILSYQKTKADREATKAKTELDSARIKADVVKAKEATKKAEAEAETAKMEMKKVKQDRKAGLATERETKLLQAKIGYRATTISGGIAKRINQFLTSGYADKKKSERVASGKVEADKILSKYNTEKAESSAKATNKAAKAATKAANKAIKAANAESKKSYNQTHIRITNDSKRKKYWNT